MVNTAGLIVLLAVKFVAAFPKHHERDARPRGIVDPGISPYCTYYDEAINNLYDCPLIISEWGMSLQDFIEWVCLSFTQFSTSRAASNYAANKSFA